MYCPKCGTKQESDWKCCPKCAQQEPSIIRPEEEKPNWGKIISFTVGLLLMVAIIFSNIDPVSSPSPQASKPASPADSLQILSEWTWESSQGGYGHIRGSVKNIGNKPITAFEIIADLKDENGRVIDTVRDVSTAKLEPGNQKKFEIMHRLTKEIKSANLKVGTVRN